MPGAALTARVTLPVTVHVDGAGDVPATVRLYGPGDVTGLDPAQIVRCDPPPSASRFEAGYMPQVPVRARRPAVAVHPAVPGTAKTRLRPWLVGLVTVRHQDGVRLAANPRRCQPLWRSMGGSSRPSPCRSEAPFGRKPRCHRRPPGLATLDAEGYRCETSLACHHPGEGPIFRRFFVKKF